jgi:hypothetical protein
MNDEAFANFWFDEVDYSILRESTRVRRPSRKVGAVVLDFAHQKNASACGFERNRDR